MCVFLVQYVNELHKLICSHMVNSVCQSTVTYATMSLPRNHPIAMKEHLFFFFSSIGHFFKFVKWAKMTCCDLSSGSYLKRFSLWWRQVKPKFSQCQNRGHCIKQCLIICMRDPNQKGKLNYVLDTTTHVSHASQSLIDLRNGGNSDPFLPLLSFYFSSFFTASVNTRCLYKRPWIFSNETSMSLDFRALQFTYV